MFPKENQSLEPKEVGLGGKVFTTDSPGPGDFECGPLAGSMGLTWEQVRQQHLRPHPDPLHQNLHLKEDPWVMCVHVEGAVSLYNHHTWDIRVVTLYVYMATIQWADPIQDSLIALTMPITAKDPDQDQVLDLVVNGLLQFTTILNFS